MQTHPNCMALYIVRIPQARVLPLTSFRFHLAMDKWLLLPTP